MHPSETIRGSTSSLLEGRTIALAVSGSIAAVETVKLARELIRHGASVVPFASEAALGILHPHALEWATGHEPITRLTGQVEHLWAVNGEVDAVLLAPATANTIAKAALAIDDTVVTSLVATSLGQAPVLVAPAMHEQMYASPVTQGHLDTLTARGARVVLPQFEEGEAKLAPVETIVEHVLAALGPRTLDGLRVLVVNGSTIEPMDDMRVITNKSTGRTGMALAVEAFRLGAEVEVWFGHGHTHVPGHIPIDRFVTVADLVAMAPQAAGFDWVLVPAAISDFQPARFSGKISSKQEHVLALEPTPKVLPALRAALSAGERLVAFKAESGISRDELLERASRMAKEAGADAVLANLLDEVGVDTTRLELVTDGSSETLEGDKHAVARAALTRLAEIL